MESIAETVAKKDTFVFNAIKSFKLVKSAENQITVFFPSDSAKVEFDKVGREFLITLKQKFTIFLLRLYTSVMLKILRLK